MDSTFQVLRYAALSDQWDGSYPSDHLPVLVEVKLGMGEAGGNRGRKGTDKDKDKEKLERERQHPDHRLAEPASRIMLGKTMVMKLSQVAGSAFPCPSKSDH